MKYTIDVPDYEEKRGINYHWEEGFKIKVKLGDEGVIISANEAGLKSLANHLLNLAQKSIPSGYNLHFDEYNSLEDDSLELVVEKERD